MRRRTKFDPLPALRRRVRTVLGGVLPLLVVGWLGAAGPCVGMAASPAADAAAGVAGAQGEGTGIVAPGLEAGASGEPPVHGSCPHCPGATGPATEPHALCAMLDDVSDAKRKPFWLGADSLEAAMPGPAVADTLVRPRGRAAKPAALRHWVLPSAVPLNVRHCVFIV